MELNEHRRFIIMSTITPMTTLESDPYMIPAKYKAVATKPKTQKNLNMLCYNITYCIYLKHSDI